MKNYKKNIGFFDSSYALLLFFIIHTEEINDTIFFVSDGIPKSIRKNIDNVYVKAFDFGDYGLRKKNIIQKIKVRIKYELYVNSISKRVFDFSHSGKIYGQDHIIWAQHFLNRYNNIEIFEDGFSSYTHPKNMNFTFNFLLKLFKQEKFAPYGVNDKVSKINLTGLTSIPNIIKDKVQIIDLQSLWNSKNKKEKEKILGIFNLSISKIENISKKKVLLLTQTLSEDRLMTEEEKIELYREMLRPYNARDVLIKPHPREKTEYSKFFPEYEIIVEHFPVQLLKLNQVQFEEVVTVFSTAANDFLNKETKLVFKGTQFNERISKMYGNIVYNSEKKEIEYEKK